MKLRETLREGVRLLAQTGSDETQLEAELLLRQATGLDKVRLYERLAAELSHDEDRAFRVLLGRRLAREPTPYITGRREFFGLEFEVTPAALIPRPETETLVEMVIAFARRRAGALTIADIGAGSGAIAVALARALPQARLIATDISPEALALAERNAECHGVSDRITFFQGDLLAPLPNAAHPEPLDTRSGSSESKGHPEPNPGASRGSSRRASPPVGLIVSNPPYLTTAQWKATPPEIRSYEPREALDGGADGLDLIRRLLAQAPSHLAPAGAMFVEIGDEQGAAARESALAAFPSARIAVRPDLAGRDRVLVIET